MSPLAPAAPAGSTLLQLACRSGADAASEVLTAAFSRWAPHMLPLHCAARLGAPDALRVLLAAGADLTYADTWHGVKIQAAADAIDQADAATRACRAAVAAAERALSRARRAARRAAAVGPAAFAVAEADRRRCLRSKELRRHDLSAASRNGDYRRGRHALLVALHASPLHLLALAGSELRPDWVEVWQHHDDEERLLPAAAGVAGAVEGARILLQAGADVSARDANDRTPLHWAARSGNAQLVRRQSLLRARPHADSVIIVSSSRHI